MSNASELLRDQCSTSRSCGVRLSAVNEMISSVRWLRGSLALVMAAWITGIGCAFGCGGLAMRAAGGASTKGIEDRTTLAGTADSMDAGHCAHHQTVQSHRKHHRAVQAHSSAIADRAVTDPAVAPFSNEIPDQCPLAINSTTLTGKPNAGTTHASLSVGLRVDPTPESPRFSPDTAAPAALNN